MDMDMNIKDDGKLSVPVNIHIINDGNKQVDRIIDEIDSNAFYTDYTDYTTFSLLENNDNHVDSLQTRGNEIHTTRATRGISKNNRKTTLIPTVIRAKSGGVIPSSFHRQQSLGRCGTVLDEDRDSFNPRYNFFVEIWDFLLKVAGVSDDTFRKQPINKDTTHRRFAFNFYGFIIVLRVNTKLHGDGCNQTAYSIIINIDSDIHFTLFFNIYRDSSGNRCRPDESSALHISVKKPPHGKYRLYIPWEYVLSSDNDAREFLIISIYKISYYLLEQQTCKAKSLGSVYNYLITSIETISGGERGRLVVSSKMKKLAIHLGDELNDFYSELHCRRRFNINTVCPGYTGGNKKISKKLERYLLKQKEYINKLKLLRKNKTKNKNKIEKNNKLINELKIKIKKQKAKEKLKKEKAKAKEKLKLKKAKAKLKKLKVKKVHIAKKLKNKK